MAGSEPPKPPTGDAPSSDQLHAQAVRFLTSLNVSGSDASESDKRQFLESKGLSPDQIDRAFSDAKRPPHVDGEQPNHASPSPTTSPSESESSSDPFDRAARAFDDPIHAPPEAAVAPLEPLPSEPPSVPPRSYPRSPLALYYSQQQQSDDQGLAEGGAAASAWSRRYEVLLSFFRTLSYLLMLGGSVAAVLVALYRSYLMPRLVAMFDARASLLRHHHSQYTTLLNSIRSLHSRSLVPEELRITVPPSESAGETASAKADAVRGMAEAQKAGARKGVLKRVHFADQMAAKGDVSSGHEDKRDPGDSSGGKDQLESKELVVRKEQGGAAGGSGDGGSTTADGAAATAEAPTAAEAERAAFEARMKSVDLTKDLRLSLSRLAEALRADTTAASVGMPISGPPPAATPDDDDRDDATTTSSRRSTGESGAMAATVADEDGSSDELEFDPFAPPPPSSSSSSRRSGATGGQSRKHSPQSTSSLAELANLARRETPRQADALHDALCSLTNSMHAQALRFQEQPYSSGGVGGGGFGYGGAGAGPTSRSSFNVAPAAGLGSGHATPTGGAAQAPTVDVAQLKAEIRSLKGLLLSRRNFPTYGRAPAAAVVPTAATTASADAPRAG